MIGLIKEGSGEILPGTAAAGLDNRRKLAAFLGAPDGRQHLVVSSRPF